MMKELSKKSLNSIIFDDVLTNNKKAVLLLIFIFMSAVAVLKVTNEIRNTISQQRIISKEIKELENDYMHLKLEEDIQSERSKIEAEARSLGLLPLQKHQETILIERK